MRQVDLASPRSDDADRFFECRHHAQPQQIDFDDAQVRAVVFIPLHHRTSRHAGVFERHDRIEIAAADDHAAGVLPEMPRQVLHRETQLDQMLDPRMGSVEAGRPQLVRQLVGVVGVFKAMDGIRQTADHLFGEAEHLADFADSAFAAVGDDVGRHAGAARAVSLVDVLQHPFALVAAGQVDVDIGPFAAFFGKKPFKQQIHADRIDSRNAQAVADGAVGG